MNTRRRCTIAVAYRSHGVGIAVIRGTYLVEVRRHRLEPGNDVHFAIRKLVRKALADYGTNRIVVERDGEADLATANMRGLAIRTLSLSEAKRTLLPRRDRITHVELAKHLLREHPKLRRLVTVLRLSGEIAINEARRLVPLHAVALGLAADSDQPRK
ncbi:MAG: hypothetical protein WC931_02205 [Bacilli bacterium]|jgi:hypothetical protein